MGVYESGMHMVYYIEKDYHTALKFLLIHYRYLANQKVRNDSAIIAILGEIENTYELLGETKKASLIQKYLDEKDICRY